MQASGELRLPDILALNDEAGRQQIERLLAGEIMDYRGEHLCLDRQGNLSWVALSIFVSAPQTEGRPDVVITQMSNMNRLKRLEEALERSESRWIHSFNNSWPAYRLNGAASPVLHMPAPGQKD